MNHIGGRPRYEGGRKICMVCDRAKPTAEFWKDRASEDGLQPTCKECWRTRKRIRERTPKAKGEQLSLLGEESNG